MLTEHIEEDLLNLDLRDDQEILQVLLRSQQQALDAVAACSAAMEIAVQAAVSRLQHGTGRLVLVGAGASGRLAVQDGAEMWPTYGWPHERLLLRIAGGEQALIKSVEGTEDDEEDAARQVLEAAINQHDVVIAVAASGRSPWTCRWLRDAREASALGIAMANNANTPLLDAAEHPLLLDSGAEVLAGSTRMAAGTAQKIALNLFSTLLMIRLNRTYGNLMVDMAAVNQKLDGRRIRMLQAISPSLAEPDAQQAILRAGGWVKLAALIARGCEPEEGRALLTEHHGSLRNALSGLDD